MPEAAIRVACLGECMVELREHGPGLFAQGFAGDTFNTAVYLKRLGGERFAIDYATGIGTDRFADDMLAFWRAESIGTRLVRRIPERCTGLYSIRTDPDGERHFSYWRETSAARVYFASATTPLEAAIDTIDVLYLSGISLAVLEGALPERLPTLARRLRARGGKVVFDNNFRARLWPDAHAARSAFAALYALCDVALVTLDDEAAREPGASPERLLADAFALPAAEVVVKRGAAPTLVRHGGAIAEVPVAAVAPAVDTTAAGDSFAAGYLCRRLAGSPPAEAAAFANRVAGVVIGHAGAIIGRDAFAAALAPP